MTKSEIEIKLKTLRAQMSKMETRAQEREDKLLKILFALEPFVEVLTSAQQKEMTRVAGLEL